MKTPLQSNTTFQDVSDRIWQHLVERDWQDNAARGLAISIALEANELLEHYQWHDEPVGDTEALAEELADIFIYGFQFAQKYNIDIADAIQKKLQKAALKYPADQFKGREVKERDEAWIRAKLGHKKEGL